MQKVITLIILSALLSNCSFKKDVIEPKSAPIKTEVIDANNETLLLTSIQTDLLDLVTFGNSDSLNAFLNKHPDLDLNYLNRDGLSPLAIALKGNRNALANILINKGASIFWDLEHSKYDVSYLLPQRYRVRFSQLKSANDHSKVDPTPTTESSLDPESIYETVTREVAEALHEKNLLRIRVAQQKNRISCDLLSGMIIEVLQFDVSDSEKDKSIEFAQDFLARANCSPSSSNAFSRVIYNYEWLRLLISNSDDTRILDLILSRFPATSTNIEERPLEEKNVWITLTPKALFASYDKALPESLSKFAQSHSNGKSIYEIFTYKNGYQKILDANSATLGTIKTCFIYYLLEGRYNVDEDCHNSTFYTDKDDY